MNNDVFTLDENNNAAIRTLGVKAGTTETNSPSVFTEDENGNAAIRVTGGGGDQNNLGYFATLQALQEAYPTAEPGNWAIVGATDTVWIWDEDTSAWVDSDQKGQVTSVNGQTGAVTLGINDVAPTQTGKSGYVLGTDGFVAGWVKPEIVQRSTMPQASEDELGNVYQFVGTTDANYTNGYFYKCVSDGQNPATYSWTQVSVQPAPSGLPSQTGNAGKFLTTDGTDASWSSTVTTPVSIIDSDTSSSASQLVLGRGNDANYYFRILARYGVANTIIGVGSGTGATNSLSLGTNSLAKQNANPFDLGNSSRKFDVIYATKLNNGADINVPTTGGTLALLSDIPTDPLPSQTGNAGKVLMTNGTTASWEDISSSPATMPELTVADWSSNTQTVNVTGVTASNVVIVSPAPASAADYAAAGIICTAQGSGTLTFTCTTVPSNAITVNVIIM